MDGVCLFLRLRGALTYDSCRKQIIGWKNADCTVTQMRRGTQWPADLESSKVIETEEEDGRLVWVLCAPADAKTILKKEKVMEN